MNFFPVVALASLSGAFSVLGWDPFGWWPIALLGYAALFWLVSNSRSALQACLLGLACIYSEVVGSSRSQQRSPWGYFSLSITTIPLGILPHQVSITHALPTTFAIRRAVTTINCSVIPSSRTIPVPHARLFRLGTGPLPRQ